ncbi:flavin reductase [Mesorhizobium sp. M1403]|uniref:flavin reductase n=1 Tax=Mesorhizobium sp. M1403 TaxID=2957097 RepID=UPI0033381A61
MSLSEANNAHPLAARDKPLPVERGNPVEDPRLFRRCLGQYATGIAIITTQVDGRRAGVTVNSFASVSLDPPLVLWSISHSSRSFPTFKLSDRFAVNVLSSQQIELSRHFSSNVEDKFADANWFEGKFGLPLLEGCIAHYECRHHSQFEGGDHKILVGLAEHVSRYEGEPLLFTQGQYSIASTHPEVPPNPEAVGSLGGGDVQETLIPLIFEAHNILSLTFDEHRRAEGVNIAVARVLTSVYDTPGMTLDMVARETYLGQRDIEDAITSLRTKSLLTSGPAGKLILTDGGHQLREAIGQRWQKFQMDQVAGIQEQEMQIALRTLKKLISQNRVDK